MTEFSIELYLLTGLFSILKNSQVRMVASDGA